MKKSGCIKGLDHDLLRVSGSTYGKAGDKEGDYERREVLGWCERCGALVCETRSDVVLTPRPVELHQGAKS